MLHFRKCLQSLLVDVYASKTLLKKTTLSSSKFFSLFFKKIVFSFNRNITSEVLTPYVTKIIVPNYIDFMFENTLLSYSFFLKRIHKNVFLKKKNYKEDTISYFWISLVFYKKKFSFFFINALVYFSFFLFSLNLVSLINKDKLKLKSDIKDKALNFNSTSLSANYFFTILPSFKTFFNFFKVFDKDLLLFLTITFVFNEFYYPYYIFLFSFFKLFFNL